MDISLMLNRSTAPESSSKDLTASLRPGQSSLPTPSPECPPAKQANSVDDNGHRKPWDGNGFYLPKGASQGQPARLPFRPAEDTFQAPMSSHSRHASVASMESPMALAAPVFPASFSHPRQARRMHSSSDVQHDALLRRSSETRPPQSDARRPSLLLDHGMTLAGVGGSLMHHVSDSRSSLSSIASSTFSGGHSRFSSMSTVGSHHHHGSVAETPLESRLEQLPPLTTMPEFAAHQELSPRLPPLPPYNYMPPRAPSLPRGLPEAIWDLRAVKKKRSRLSVDQSHPSLRSSILNPLHRVHKRTISAPNPPHLSSPFPRQSSCLPPITSDTLEPEPALAPPRLTMPRTARSVSRGRRPSRADISPIGIPASRSVDMMAANASRSPIPQLPVLSAPVASSPDFRARLLNTCASFGLSPNTILRGGDLCMHVNNCATGSVPRKVISHLFGRNKVCTRRIPERAWVCMCRKHYQRIRYRKGAEFSLTQIELVHEQIARMIYWSYGLEKNGSPNVEGASITSWSFSIRKRELRRLVESNGAHQVPHWILENLGEGKTHDDIFNIVERLHHELKHGILTDVPPIEFLPDVLEAYAPRAAHSPDSTGREGSDDVDMHDAALGEEASSPFSKDTSPLEPVKEERADYRNHGLELVSPGLSVASEDTLRPRTSMGHQHQQNSPGAQMVHEQPDDGRNSHPTHDSQNPQLPPMNEADINFQMQESTVTTGGLRLYKTCSPRGALSSINNDLMLSSSRALDRHGSSARAMPFVDPWDIAQFGGYSYGYHADGFSYTLPPVQSGSSMLPHSSSEVPYPQTSTRPYLPGIEDLERRQMPDFSTESARGPWQGQMEAGLGYNGQATEARVSHYAPRSLQQFDDGLPIVSQGSHEYGGLQGSSPEVDGNQDM